MFWLFAEFQFFLRFFSVILISVFIKVFQMDQSLQFVQIRQSQVIIVLSANFDSLFKQLQKLFIRKLSKDS